MRVRRRGAQVDSKKELEKLLKATCEAFIMAATKLAVEPMLSFITKVTAVRVAASAPGAAAGRPLREQARAGARRRALCVWQACCKPGADAHANQVREREGARAPRLCLAALRQHARKLGPVRRGVTLTSKLTRAERLAGRHLRRRSGWRRWRRACARRWAARCRPRPPACACTWPTRPRTPSCSSPSSPTSPRRTARRAQPQPDVLLTGRTPDAALPSASLTACVALFCGRLRLTANLAICPERSMVLPVHAPHTRSILRGLRCMRADGPATACSISVQCSGVPETRAARTACRWRPCWRRSTRPARPRAPA